MPPRSAAGARQPRALFAFAQTVVDGGQAGATVVVPNRFLPNLRRRGALGRGRHFYCVNADLAAGFAHDWGAVPDAVWSRTQLVYVCSPDNPTRPVLDRDGWRALFELSDKHGFVIASDECYSEIYFDEAHAPLGALGAAHALGRTGYPRLVVFGSLSKRSNAPGLRSGYAAGDASLIKAFLLYPRVSRGAMSERRRHVRASQHGTTRRSRWREPRAVPKRNSRRAATTRHRAVVHDAGRSVAIFGRRHADRAMPRSHSGCWRRRT